jgi:hypothetical protein
MDSGLAMYEIFNEYYSLSSSEWRRNIIGYEPLDESVDIPKDADKTTAIKVIFNDKSWIRVYRRRNEVEWY